MRILEQVNKMEDAKKNEKWEGTKKITVHGNSFTVNITEAVRMLDLDRGDYVDVTIRKK